MRDLATYESNFSDTISLRSGMLKLHKELIAMMGKFSHINKDTGDQWIDSKTKNVFISNLT